MKFSSAKSASLACLVVMMAAATSGCGFVNGIRAKSELNEGARLYRTGDFAGAQQRFARALELNNDQRNAQLFLARSIDKQFRPPAETDEQRARVNEAIAAYERVLAQEPSDNDERDATARDEAHKAIIRLLNALGNEPRQMQLLEARARDESVSRPMRSWDLTYLAGKDWTCANTVIDANKQTIQRDNRQVISYNRPQDPTQFTRAMECAQRGLERVNQAVEYDSNSVAAWAVKANLLLAMSRLSEMEGNAERRTQFDREFEQARETSSRLQEEARRLRQEEQRARQAEREG